MKVKLLIPESLKDIKLSQYQRFIRNTKDIEDINYINTQLISCFCNIEDKLVKHIAKHDYDDLINHLTNLIDNKHEYKLQRIVKVDGVKYGFIPCLDDITVGEQADIDENINDVDKLHRAMKVMYRPVTVHRNDKYLIEDYTGEENDIDLTMDIVNGALVFFYNLLNDCLNCIQSYIEVEALTNQKLQNLEVNGIGISQSMASLKAIFSDLRMSLNYDYMKHYSL